MRELGITGAVRGRKVITTIPDQQAERAPDRVDRGFVATAPNRCWVADFTHVAAWAGVVHVAFVVDTFSRRVVGWSAATSKETRLVLDALEMALWQRDRDEHPHTRGELIHHSDAGSQYTSFKLAEHLDVAGIAASIGSVGDAYDNALMESTIGLFKTELIKPQRPWKTLSQIAASAPSSPNWRSTATTRSSSRATPRARPAPSPWPSSRGWPATTASTRSGATSATTTTTTPAPTPLPRTLRRSWTTPRPSASSTSARPRARSATATRWTGGSGRPRTSTRTGRPPVSAA